MKQVEQKNKGYIQVYTGNGKGKTTAAVGLAIRALGAGKRVYFLQFMKSNVYSEHKILSSISPNMTIETLGKPFFIIKEGSMSDQELNEWKDKAVIFPAGKPPENYLKLAAEGIKKAREALATGKYDLVILDEIIVAQYFELVTWKQLQDLIETKNHETELVLTGRGATPELIDKADLVTEMKELKHYYRQGVGVRKGIES